MKNFKFIITLFLFLLLSVSAFYNRPKQIIYNFDNDINELINRLPPLDQGSGNDIIIPKNIRKQYINDTKKQACIINKVSISCDKIDVDQSITINVEIQNISKLDNCPCVLKIETSDHFDIPKKDKIKIVLLDNNKIINPCLWLLNPKKRGVATITVSKLVDGSQFNNTSTQKITINRFYGFNKGYIDFILFIVVPITACMSLILLFREKITINMITFRKRKPLIPHKKYQSVDNFIEIITSKQYFSLNIIR